jgi:hypothetical protein
MADTSHTMQALTGKPFSTKKEPAAYPHLIASYQI